MYMFYNYHWNKNIYSIQIPIYPYRKTYKLG